jgi:hypothetical protein
MSDAPRRLIQVGTFPMPTGGDVIFVGGDDPARLMLAEANAKLDREREEAERRRRAQISDVERAKMSVRGMRLARAARRFGHALKVFARMR